MLIVMSPRASEADLARVSDVARSAGFAVHRAADGAQTVLACVADPTGAVPAAAEMDASALRRFELLAGVQEVLRVGSPYQLASRSFQPEDTVIQLGDVAIGGGAVVLMAGPCTIESEDQVERLAPIVKRAGAGIMRGGAFKPRSSPYSYQGMGEDGLKMIARAAARHGLLVVSEVMDRSQIGMMEAYVDILQVGARNMQNFDLLKDLGRCARPVLIKRGMAATIEELLLSAEYVMAGGNRRVILCERGIRTFERATRYTLDLAAVPVVKALSHLPIVVDPSHAVGLRDKIPPAARAAVAAGADGLLIEVHDQPEEAKCDGAQSLLPEQLDALAREVGAIARAIGRSFG